MRPLRFIAGIALGTLLVGCAELATESGSSRTPSFNFTDGPPVAGGDNVAVFRFQGFWYWYWTDPPLRAWHTSFPLSGSCGPDVLLEPWDMQDVANFKEFLKVTRVAQADVHIIVVDQTQPGPCLGATLLAEGMGQIRQTDNDYFAFDPYLRGDRTNANAFGFSAHGALQGVGGERMTYNGHWRRVWNPDDPTFGSVSVEVSLH